MSRTRSAVLLLLAFVTLACASVSKERQAELMARAKRVDRALDVALKQAYDDKDPMQRDNRLQSLSAMAQKLDFAMRTTRNAHKSLDKSGLDRSDADITMMEIDLGIGPPPEEE